MKWVTCRGCRSKLRWMRGWREGYLVATSARMASGHARHWLCYRVTGSISWRTRFCRFYISDLYRPPYT